MISNWNFSWSDIAAALTAASQVAVVMVLARVYVRQRRQHRLTLTQLNRLAAAARALTLPQRGGPAPGQVIQLDEWRP
jgi:hypothetical protein